jgi:hypothetical protein
LWNQEKDKCKENVLMKRKTSAIGEKEDKSGIVPVINYMLISTDGRATLKMLRSKSKAQFVK